MTFAPPELLPLYEPMKGFVCVSSAKHRGVIEHEGVVSISPGQNYGGEKTVAVMGDDVDPIAHYLLDEVGARGWSGLSCTIPRIISSSTAVGLNFS